MQVRDMVKLVYLIMMATLPERLEAQQLSYSIRKGGHTRAYVNCVIYSDRL